MVEGDVLVCMNNLAKRMLVIVPAVALQLAWLYILWTWLAPWAASISIVLVAFSFVLVLYIVTKRDEGTYKMLWLLVILSFPLPGTILYLVFGNKRTTGSLRRRLAKVAGQFPSEHNSQGALDALEGSNPRMAQTFAYLGSIADAQVYPNDGARYYALGDDLFPAMLDAMEQARSYIFMEYFIVTPGAMWDALVEVMERKVAEGVDVRLLYDDVGSISTFSYQDVLALRAKGIQCAPFNPLVFVKGVINYRDHRKMLVVDGTVAFTGGVNLADEYINAINRFGHWKDTGIRLTGEPVQAYVHMFVEFWNAFAEHPIPQNLVAPPTPKDPVSKKSADGWVLSYYDSPLRTHAASNELYIELLSQATEYAWFFTPYLLPGDALLNALVRAAERGVDVRIIMPGIPDKKLVFRMAHSFYPVLLEAGVRIYEYTPGFVHAKGCVVDDIVGTVGTVNLDYRSLFLHFENNVLLYQASMLADLKVDFETTLGLCRAMELGTNVRMSFGRWLADGALRLFAPLC